MMRKEEPEDARTIKKAFTKTNCCQQDPSLSWLLASNWWMPTVEATALTGCKPGQ